MGDIALTTASQKPAFVLTDNQIFDLATTSRPRLTVIVPESLFSEISPRNLWLNIGRERVKEFDLGQWGSLETVRRPQYSATMP
jgi:hypothetical protein